MRHLLLHPPLLKLLALMIALWTSYWLWEIYTILHEDDVEYEGDALFF